MYISINDLKINYEVFGKGDPMLLLHGWGGSLESLTQLAKRLTAYPSTKLRAGGLQCILIDLPGFGKSDKPKRDFSLNDYAEIVEKILNGQEIDNIYVFGHSFGGSVAIKLALRKKIKIKKLILCNSSGVRQLKIKNEKLRKGGIKCIKKIFSLPGLKIIYQPLRKFFYYYILRNRDYIDYLEIAGTYKKVIEEDLTPQLKDIDIPVLLLWGEKDQDTPVEHAQIFILNIEDCKLKIIKGEGHGLPKFKPQEIAIEVVAFTRG